MGVKRFFSIPDEHIAQLDDLYTTQNAMDSVIEECAELIHAIQKYVRYSDKPHKYNVVMEMAHCLVSISLLAWKLKIPMKDIDKQIMFKAKAGNFTYEWFNRLYRNTQWGTQ